MQRDNATWDPLAKRTRRSIKVTHWKESEENFFGCVRVGPPIPIFAPSVESRTHI